MDFWVAISAGSLVVRLVRLPIDMRTGVDFVAMAPGGLYLDELDGVVVGEAATV